MSRDFEVIFSSNTEKDVAFNILKKIEVNSFLVFEDIKIRDKSLFVTLSYSKKILKTDFFEIAKNKIFISDHIVSVAFKNGEHCSTGYAFLSHGVDEGSARKKIKVWDIKNIILKYFERAQV